MSEPLNPYTHSPQEYPVVTTRRPRQRSHPAGLLPLSGMMMTFMNILWFGMTACLCGHTGKLTAMLTVPAFLASLAIQFAARRQERWERLLCLFFTITQFLFLANNLADLLWFGHSAWLR